jgi:glycosyltransferase involved in cell wall biosynthesis
MRILFLGPKPPPITGQAIANEMACRRLQGRGHSVLAVDTMIRSEITDVSRQGRFSLAKFVSSIKTAFTGIWIILRGKIDICYVSPGQTFFGYLRFLPFILIARMINIPVVAHFHGGYFRNMYDQLNRKRQWLVLTQLRFTTTNIVLGESLKYMFKNLVVAERVVVCANGVPSAFHFSDEDIRLKLYHTRQSTVIEVLYLSNLIKSKGILDLIDAIVILNSRGRKAVCVLAGSIDPDIEGEVTAALRSYPNAFMYKGVIGGMKKKAALLQADVFCLPTYYPVEGQPISILEAYAAGCAVVTTNQGGISDIFVSKKNGVYCYPHNPESIANAIEESWEERTNYARTNHQYYLEHFTEECFIERLDHILQSAMPAPVLAQESDENPA